MSNNFFSVTNYNAINGAHLEDSLSFTYYPKEIFYESFGGEGIRILQSFRLPFPVFNFSTPKFAITTNISNNIDNTYQSLIRSYNLTIEKYCSAIITLPLNKKKLSIYLNKTFYIGEKNLTFY